MTRTDAPRTRRQLREALSQHRFQLATLSQYANYLEDTLRQLGATQRSWITRGTGYAPDITTSTWDLPAQPAGEPKVLTQAEHEKVITALVGEAAVSTRRETLTAVIDALQIAGHESGWLLEDPDTFWAEIQTALDVRAEEKKAAERKRIAEKVDGLRKRTQPLLGFDAATGVEVFASIHDDGRIQIDRVTEPTPTKVAETREPITLSDYDRELLENMPSLATLVDQLGVGRKDAGAFAETVEKLGDDHKPKKPAKKKKEGDK